MIENVPAIANSVKNCFKIADYEIGKDYEKKEKEYQKSIYYASNGYQYYGESGQDTNTKLFWKGVVWKFDIWDSSLVFFLE